MEGWLTQPTGWRMNGGRKVAGRWKYTTGWKDNRLKVTGGKGWNGNET